MTTLSKDDLRKQELKRRMKMMLIIFAIVFGSIFLYKAAMGFIMKIAMGSQSRAVSVSTMQAQYAHWDSELQSVGSLRAIRGVNVTTELAGLVRSIYFAPGSFVDAGVVLIELNTTSDVALFRALQATAELNQITYQRDKRQFAIKAISKETLDTDEANLKNSVAQVDQQAAIIAKKIIRAPFSGRLGISAVNPGQYLNPGDSVVTLQQLDPIYVDFYIPQQEVTKLAVNQNITLKSDALPGKTYQGTITTINPVIDSSTRNVEVEATIHNPAFELIPGMFGNVTINTGAPRELITLPQTVVAYNPYGNLVYVVHHEEKHKLTVKQIFVTTGETRGEQVAILTGLKPGDEIVTSGQLKLKNGSEVVIDNSIQPSNNAESKLSNEH